MWMKRAAAVHREDGRRHGASSAAMHTEAINHEPAITYMQTGNQVTGRPCLGAWAQLRPRLAEPEPADVRRDGRQADATQEQVQAISARLWQSGYLPGEHAGVSFRTRRRPDPATSTTRRACTPRRAPHDARRPQQAQRDELPSRSATPRRRPASRSTRWPSACRRACPN